MTRDEYKAILYRYFPNGSIWPKEPGDQPEWDALIDALSGAPASTDAAAIAMLAEIFPDTTEDFLEHWETLVGLPDQFSIDGEDLETRRNAVLAKLAYLGKVNIHDLEDTMRIMRNNDIGFRLINRVVPPFQVGISGAHGAVGDAWAAVWGCEYMTNRIASAPDDFESWNISGTATVTNNVAQSPVTELASAAHVQIDAGSYIWHGITGTGVSVNNTVRATVWIKAVGAPESDVQIVIRDRSGTEQEIYRGRIDSWVKIVGSIDVGSGGITPSLRIKAPTEALDLYVSWARAGVRDTVFESRAALLAPINTRPEFRVKGEAAGAIEVLTFGGETITFGGEAITAAL